MPSNINVQGLAGTQRQEQTALPSAQPKLDLSSLHLPSANIPAPDTSGETRYWQTDPGGGWNPTKGALANLWDLARNPVYFMSGKDQNATEKAVSTIYQSFISAASAGWSRKLGFGDRSQLTEEDMGLLQSFAGALGTAAGFSLMLAGPGKLIKALGVPKHLAPIVLGGVYGAAEPADSVAQKFSQVVKSAGMFGAFHFGQEGLGNALSLPKGMRPILNKHPRTAGFIVSGVPFGVMEGAGAAYQGASPQEIAARTLGATAGGGLLGIGGAARTARDVADITAQHQATAKEYGIPLEQYQREAQTGPEPTPVQPGRLEQYTGNIPAAREAQTGRNLEAAIQQAVDRAVQRISDKIVQGAEARAATPALSAPTGPQPMALPAEASRKLVTPVPTTPVETPSTPVETTGIMARVNEAQMRNDALDAERGLEGNRFEEQPDGTWKLIPPTEAGRPTIGNLYKTGPHSSITEPGKPGKPLTEAEKKRLSIEEAKQIPLDEGRSREDIIADAKVRVEKERTESAAAHKEALDEYVRQGGKGPYPEQPEGYKAPKPKPHTVKGGKRRTIVRTENGKRVVTQMQTTKSDKEMTDLYKRSWFHRKPVDRSEAVPGVKPRPSVFDIEDQLFRDAVDNEEAHYDQLKAYDDAVQRLKKDNIDTDKADRMAKQQVWGSEAQEIKDTVENSKWYRNFNENIETQKAVDAIKERDRRAKLARTDIAEYTAAEQTNTEKAPEQRQTEVKKRVKASIDKLVPKLRDVPEGPMKDQLVQEVVGIIRHETGATPSEALDMIADVMSGIKSVESRRTETTKPEPGGIGSVGTTPEMGAVVAGKVERPGQTAAEHGQYLTRPTEQGLADRAAYAGKPAEQNYRNAKRGEIWFSPKDNKYYLLAFQTRKNLQGLWSPEPTRFKTPGTTERLGYGDKGAWFAIRFNKDGTLDRSLVTNKRKGIYGVKAVELGEMKKWLNEGRPTPEMEDYLISQAEGEYSKAMEYQRSRPESMAFATRIKQGKLKGKFMSRKRPVTKGYDPKLGESMTLKEALDYEGRGGERGVVPGGFAARPPTSEPRVVPSPIDITEGTTIGSDWYNADMAQKKRIELSVIETGPPSDTENAALSEHFSPNQRQDAGDIAKAIQDSSNKRGKPMGDAEAKRLANKALLEGEYPPEIEGVIRNRC